jgi:hypothetical protein
VNISEANDLALFLAFVTGNTARDPIDVAFAANRLAMRAGKALDVSGWKIATPVDIETAIADLAERHADAENYSKDHEDGYPDIEDVLVGGNLL